MINVSKLLRCSMVLPYTILENWHMSMQKLIKEYPPSWDEKKRGRKGLVSGIFKETSRAFFVLPRSHITAENGMFQ